MTNLFRSWKMAVITALVFIIPVSMGQSSWVQPMVPFPTGCPRPVTPGTREVPTSRTGTKGLGDKIYPTNDAAENEYPFMVALLGQDGSHYCTGSLIHKRWVLTAAHCSTSAISSVRLGAYDLSSNESDSSQVISVAQMIPHPDYAALRTDISLVKLSSPVTVTGDPSVAIVELLSSAGLKAKILDNQKTCKVAGWGLTKYPNGWFPATRPQHQDIRFVNRTEAITRGYATVDQGAWWLHTEALYDNACGWGSTCNGDSGGPIFCRAKSTWIQVALTATSSGFDGCIRGVKGSTDVHYFKDWIESIVGAL